MKIFLAGLDNGHHMKAISLTGHKHGLISYYALTKQTKEAISEMVIASNSLGMHIIVDSGLFTFMFGTGKGKTYSAEWMSEYTKRYIDTMHRLGIKKMSIVECDVHKILGMDWVFKLREEFEKSGLDVIYVWHVEERIDGLMKMVNKYDYVALSIPELRIVFKGNKTSYKAATFDLLKKISLSCDKIPRIHLLGNTVEDLMKTRLAYSCDSTSWQSGIKYGSGIVYSDGTLKHIHIRSKAWRQIFDNHLRRRPDMSSEIDKLTTSPNYRIYLKNCFISGDAYTRYNDWLSRNYQWVGEKND